jgi:hypothetical protein
MNGTHGLAAMLGVALVAPTLANAAPRDATVDPTPAATTVTVALVEPGYDAFTGLLDEEARLAMNAGDYRRAWYLFWRLLAIDPDDTRALRESARVAQALGAFTYSVDAFARVDFLSGGRADPELHYLRGEALAALGRRPEAEREWSIAVRELEAAPRDRRAILWLARIAALRGQLGQALALYEPLLPIDEQSAEYAEVRLYEVEARILSKRWRAAERALRAFLLQQPAHPRALGLLAWVLEARGHDDGALVLRAAFAEDWTEHPRKTVEYARALERVHRLSAALDRYREARALGVDDLDVDIARMRGRVAPELAAGASVRVDGSGTVAGWSAGANLPLGGRRRLVVSAVRETSTGGGALGDDTAGSAALWGLLTTPEGAGVGVGVTARQRDHDRGLGASAIVTSSPERAFQLQLRGDYGLPWRESATTVREGGVFDAATIAGYGRIDGGRVLIGAGLLGRRLALAPRADEGTIHAVQMLGFAGVDLNLLSDPTRAARGEILGDELLSSRALATALVLSYRHYELSADDPFGERLDLVTRSSVDELSTAARAVLDPDGMVAGELRGGIGHDWIRGGVRLRAGASLLLSFTRGSRLTFDYDVGSESQTGLIGRRHAGTAVLHVDL